MGDSNTGKTSLVLRFVEGHYRDSRGATVGAFFLTKRLTLDKMTCKLLLWDTAGQEQFQKLAVTYYRQAAAAIVCFDVSRPAAEQMARLQAWLDQIHFHLASASHRIVLCVAACKGDLPAAEGLEEQAQALAERYGALYMKTSAKSNYNVTAVFQRTAEFVLHYQQEAINGKGRPIPVTLGMSMSTPRRRSFAPRTNATTMPRTTTAPPTAASGNNQNQDQNGYETSTFAHDPMSRESQSDNHVNARSPLSQQDNNRLPLGGPEDAMMNGSGQHDDDNLQADTINKGSEPSSPSKSTSNVMEHPRMMCDNGILVCGSSQSGGDCIIL